MELKDKVLKCERVVFLQGFSAKEALEIYEEKGAQAAFEYLKQWHYLGEHEFADCLGHGTSDRTFWFEEDYVLTVNQGLEYIGLEYILERENK